MTDGNGAPPRGGMRPWLRVLLVASLAVNLLVLGALGGAVMTWGHGPHFTHGRGIGGPLTRALDRDDRRAIGREMRRTFGGAHRGAGPAGGDPGALVADLRAVPFDPAPVEDRLSRHREALGKRMEMGQRLLLERLSEMSDAERAAFADRFERHLRDHRPHHR